mgnify:CR=1 FL=1
MAEINLVRVELTCQKCLAEMRTVASVGLITEACDLLMSSHTCVPKETNA